MADSALDGLGGNAAYVEDMRARHARDARSVPESWRRYFAAQPDAAADHDEITAAIVQRSRQSRAAAVAAPAAGGGEKQFAVDNLVNQYRFWGVRAARINPLEYEKAPPPMLSPAAHGLSDADMDAEFVTDINGMTKARLRDIIARLREVYCGSVAPEVMHLSNSEQRQWLQRRFESPRPALPNEQRARLLERLLAAETLEKYLHTRYVGQKRFSLEGGDALIPALDAILGEASAAGVQESVIGMAHRGRLNVLVNILGKRPAELFMEFEGRHKSAGGSGDVKYHMGFSSTLKMAGGKPMHLALAFNPSHLEIVNPVVEGSVRARQDRRGDAERRRVLPVLVHGDAAFAGQGVVMETLNFSQARGFKTGGTLHIIVNNQIGFTTSTPDDARSTFFCTDIAKMAEIPIVHVNADDVDGLAFAARAAFEFRQTFGVDIVIDMVCFRRHGHNEQDEPLMTQPLMYQKISRHAGTPAVYARRLADEGVVSEEQAAAMTQKYRKRLEAGESIHAEAAPTKKNDLVDWSKYTRAAKEWDWRAKKPLPMKTLRELGRRLSELPADFAPHQQLLRLIKQRREMAEGKRPLDWGMAENLSYATLLRAGVSVRLSGQDCGRGTFAHRHAVWHDQKRNKRDGGSYVPLRHVSAGGKANFLVIDSILSEEGVLGFEYGYATTDPSTLVLWEGQFGDFANGAQVVIDQFIASGEAKWGRYCGLVLLLPHGYEGQGPEHSSARLERYLQLCAEYNIQVCVPSLPAQIFHLLRRQVLREMRRPLVVISPKSLLRHPEAVSSLRDLSEGTFAPLIGETDAAIKPKGVKRLVFCSGKIYYEARAARRERKQTDVAICRLEQLYPFPHAYVAAQIKKYGAAAQVVWCQEEPGNQGAWHRLQHYFRRHLRKGQILTYALRPSSASPAAGRMDVHKRQQREVVDAALDIKSVV